MKRQVTEALRPPFVYWTCLWACGLAVAAVLTFVDLTDRWPSVPPGRDFANLYTAGQLAIDGHAYRAFDVDMFRLALRESAGTLTMQNYSYPPHALFMAVPFAALPYGLSFALWSALGMGLFYLAAKPYLSFPAFLAVLTPAATLCLWNGHYGLILGALWLWFFRYLERHPVRAGLIASLMTFKPHMGLFIGLASLTSWRALTAAALGTVGLVALSSWAFEPASWYGFVEQTTAVQSEILTRLGREFYFRMMPAAYTAYGRGSFALVAHLLIAAAAMAMLWRYRQLDPFVFATATFLIVPYVFVYDMTVACLGFAIILWRDWAILKAWERSVLTAAFFVPSINMLAWFMPVIAPPILLAALFIQTKVVR